MARHLSMIAVLLGLGLLPAGCFNPSYGDTPFLCAAEFDYACPDGFICVHDAGTGDPSTGVCTRGGASPAVDASRPEDGGAPDASIDAASPQDSGGGADVAPQRDSASDVGGQHDAATQSDGGTCQGAPVVISQVYGGGGSASALYQNDFVELLNRGATAVDVSGWSVQYASAAGSSWSHTDLVGSIPPGRYLLVAESASTGCSGNPCGSALPTPDVTGNLMMAAASGKVALVSNQTPLSASCPTAGVVDFVGYGTANCYEGAAATPVLDVTTAAVRGGAGCVHTSDNGADFTATAPTPRNGATAPHQCTGC